MNSSIRKALCRLPAQMAAMLLIAGAISGHAAPAKGARPAPRPAPVLKPAKPAVTRETLPVVLKGLGYEPVREGEYQRLKVEEEKYQYTLDFSFSKEGGWLVVMAHLAEVPDLTRLKPSPLLALLSTNDALLGMYFSYDRVNGRIMLNAALPAKGLEPALLKETIEKLKATVIRTDGLWDTAKW